MPALKKIVSCGASKEAALYFDSVFPNDFIISSLGRVGYIDDVEENALPMANSREAVKILENLIPGQPNIGKMFFEYMILEGAIFGTEFARDGFFKDKKDFIDRNYSIIENMDRKFRIDFSYDVARNKQNGFLESLNVRRKNLLRRAGFLDAPEWVLESFLSKLESDQAETDESAFALAIRGLNLVDPSRLSWEQIIEFRKDKEARSSLRRLRLFFQEELKGKDPSYASDKLASLVEDHDRATKLWGFDTVQKALSVAFTHKSLVATAAGGLAASLAGVPLAVAASASLLIPLGGFGLEFSRAIIDSAKARTTEPTKYLTRLRKLGKDEGR